MQLYGCSSRDCLRGRRTANGRDACPTGWQRNRPGVLIGHEGPGLDEFQKGRAKQLAELGYVAFALDYHGNGESSLIRSGRWGGLRSCLQISTASERSGPPASKSC